MTTILLAFALVLSPLSFEPAADASSQSRPSATRDAPVVAGELAARLDKYLTSASRFGFSGAVLVARGGRVLLHKGYGFADKSRGLPVMTETVFDIGSITKQFTAAAVMKLESQGKLSTTDPISKHLPGVPEDKAGITIHHLLTHTAGLGPYSGGDYDTSPRDETVKRTLSEPLRSEPGKEYSYSNTGYSLLAAIVERVSGEAWESFLRKNFFDPAGMRLTGYRLASWDKAQLARGYDGATDHGTPLDHNWDKAGPYWNLFGNGGILSTVGDLYKWAVALKGYKALPEAAKRKMFTPFLNDYAYGWSVTNSPHGKLITHSGGSSYGFVANLAIYPESDTFIAITSNHVPFNDFSFVQQVVSRITPAAFGAPLPEIPEASNFRADPEALKRYAGTYRLPSGDTLELTLHGDRLLMEAVGQEAVALLAGQDAASAKEFASLNARTRRMFEEALKGDYEHIRTALADEARLARWRRALEGWQKSWKERGGEVRGLEVLGTVPTWWDENDGETSATFVRVKMERGEARLFRVHWKDGKPVALGGAGIRNPAPTPLAADSRDRFVGYGLGLANAIRLEFVAGREGVAGAVIVRSKDTEAKALKVG